MLCGSGHYGIGDSRNVKEAWVSPAHKIKTDGVQRNDAETAMTEERVQSDGNQIPLSLEKRPVCQAELFQAKSTKVFLSVEYEINFIFYRIQHSFYTNATETGLQVTGYQFCHPVTTPLAQVHGTLW